MRRGDRRVRRSELRASSAKVYQWRVENAKNALSAMNDTNGLVLTNKSAILV
jgi:hypothetical protein